VHPLPEPQTERRKRSPHLLIFLLVPLLIIATFGWSYWKQRRQEFPLIAERGRTEGIPALEEGNFDKAYQLLSAAVTAVDGLGGAVDGAEDIRKAAAEAAIFVNQSSSSLEDMLEEAGRTSPESWASKFETLYKGRTYVFDTWITAVPGPEGATSYRIEYKVFPPGEASNFQDAKFARPERLAEVDLTGFELFESVPQQVGNRVIFGARLASFQYEGDSNRWVVRLDPKSGVFITHSQALQKIGWPGPDLPDAPQEGQP
jgi:hypothetical protein